MKLTLAMVQMDVALGQPEANRRKVERLLEKAADRRPDLILLPEMWNTAYALETIQEVADHDGHPTMALMAGLTKKTGANILAGSVADLRQGQAYNTAYVFDRQGRRVAEYSKIHRFRLMDEEKYITAGKEPCTFELDGVNCGLIICYDLRFPELARTLALAGAKIMFVPSEWPHPRLNHWRTLLVARAIENQMYVAGCNRVGKKGDTAFFGHSMLVDPWGEIVAEGGEEEGVIYAEIDLAKVEEVRRVMPVFADRAPGAYACHN